MLGMGAAQVAVAAIDPISGGAGFGSGGVFLDWVIPVGLLYAGIAGTTRIAGAASAATRPSVAAS